jgi:hypothetical protein
MKLLVQISNSISGYLNNIAAAYKRIELKGKLPEELKSTFEKQLMDLAVTTDKIKEHVSKLPDDPGGTNAG